jgi:hypothetical protein
MECQTCFKCGETKPLSEFYKHPQMANGHLGKCKECCKKDTVENYKKNRPHYALYERKRFQTDHRKKKVIEYQKRRRANNPEKNHCYSVTSNAIRDGKLIKQPCEVCGSLEVEAHHDDYSQPLKVRWLCRKHHLEVHGKKAYDFITNIIPFSEVTA